MGPAFRLYRIYHNDADIENAEIPNYVHQCNLKCRRCRHVPKFPTTTPPTNEEEDTSPMTPEEWAKKRRCKNRTCHGLQYCWGHMPQQTWFQQSKSFVSPGEHGLFTRGVKDSDPGNDLPVFRTGERLLAYKGIFYQEAQPLRTGQQEAIETGANFMIDRAAENAALAAATPAGESRNDPWVHDMACQRGVISIIRCVPEESLANVRVDVKWHRDQPQQQQQGVSAMEAVVTIEVIATKDIKRGIEVIRYCPKMRYKPDTHSTYTTRGQTRVPTRRQPQTAPPPSSAP